MLSTYVYGAHTNRREADAKERERFTKAIRLMFEPLIKNKWESHEKWQDPIDFLLLNKFQLEIKTTKRKLRTEKYFICRLATSGGQQISKNRITKKENQRKTRIIVG